MFNFGALQTFKHLSLILIWNKITLKNNIEKLISELPEIYQPIYGYPEFSKNISRISKDRLTIIREMYSSLQVKLDRPLRILDLGCAQGYFSLNLASLGADVLGVDYLPENIALCNALANGQSDLNVKFQVGKVEDIISNLEPNDFDLVLGLSVFHHVVYQHGEEYVKELLNNIADKCGLLVLEMALKSEPLYWGDAQPDDPRNLLTDIAFIHKVADFPTHLANIPRPMFIASNKYWILDGAANDILSWTDEPHNLIPGIHQGGRRYYKSKDQFLKMYRIDKPHFEYNKLDFKRELEFLNSAPESFFAPKLIASDKNNSDAWLIMDKVEGKLLSEILSTTDEVMIKHILKELLNQLCILEENGWYHSDIRTWNIFIQDDMSVILIDYSSMIREKYDCVWPSNIFISFVIFIYEVAMKIVKPPIPLRTVAMNPQHFPKPYNILISKFWSYSSDEWSFKLFNKLFNEFDNVKLILDNQEWPVSIEEALQNINSSYYQLVSRLNKCELVAYQAEAKAEKAKIKIEALEERSLSYLSQLQTIYSSSSWKITAPIRSIVGFLKKLKN